MKDRLPAARYRLERQSSSNAVLVACASATTLAYMSRSAISVMVVSMSAELGWSRDDEAYVLSAFYYGYICTNLLGGLLCRRFGSKVVLGLAVLGWSCMTMLLPAAAQTSTHAAWLARAVCGLCQGPTYASIYHIFSKAIKPEQRARAVAAANAGAPLGISLCYCICPGIEAQLGWYTLPFCLPPPPTPARTRVDPF